MIIRVNKQKIQTKKTEKLAFEGISNSLNIKLFILLLCIIAIVEGHKNPKNMTMSSKMWKNCRKDRLALYLALTFHKTKEVL